MIPGDEVLVAHAAREHHVRTGQGLEPRLLRTGPDQHQRGLEPRHRPDQDVKALVADQPSDGEDDRLDDAVIEAGGRLYLAKDGRMRPELLPVMYPRLDEWRDARDALDRRVEFKVVGC